jgi:7,8-dihydropterin-6-yl-methyl-4-(beta-D-ribofuranosyl)aminobenzene 5'-phosphate synthase
MEVTSLIDHVKARAEKAITTEWGLSFHVKSNDFSILFDMGSSRHFMDNASALDVDVKSVELAVLSHGHYDHGGGLRSFLTTNSTAVVHMGKGADADLYAKLFGFKRYVGLEKDILHEYQDRIRFLDDTTELRKGVFAIIPIKESYPPPTGNRFLFRRRGSILSPDDFSHELALAVETGGGLVVLTGCSHHGSLNILAAVKDALPDRPIKALFGGFHLVSLPFSWTLSEREESVRALGQEFLQSRVERFYTCHCTGLKGYRILKHVMGERLEYFPAGSRVHIS